MLEFITKEVLVPILSLVVTSVITMVGVNVRKYLNSKTSNENYQLARSLAFGIYQLLDDKYKNQEVAGSVKAKEMSEMLLSMLPTLTHVELQSINKEIHHINKEKEKNEPETVLYD